MNKATVILDRDFYIGDTDEKLFSSFVAPLGRCIYSGLYEQGHPKADENGFRTDVLEYTKALNLTLNRFPGGNYTSTYHRVLVLGPAALLDRLTFVFAKRGKTICIGGFDMDKGFMGTNVVVQIGILVHDIEQAAQDYADFLGVDKPEILMTGTLEQAGTRYLGQSSKARTKQAFFKVGPAIDIELLEPDREPSTWRADLDAKGEGVHHIAFQVKGMQEQIALFERNGMPLLQKGEYPGGRYAYMDAGKTLKTIVELLEND